MVNSVLWSRTFLPEQGKMHRLQVQADVAVWLGGSVVAESYDNSYNFSQIESKKKYDFKKEKIFHFFTTVFFYLNLRQTNFVTGAGRMNRSRSRLDRLDKTCSDGMIRPLQHGYFSPPPPHVTRE